MLKPLMNLNVSNHPMIGKLFTIHQMIKKVLSMIHTALINMELRDNREYYSILTTVILPQTIINLMSFISTTTD
ncbi:hypothetical protein XBKQ1_270003 [Xenorhabdus bovienii str. kraussei Quebec]|uniref:Transposase n=1 Tax=Xenorhabdus bovienii str. kraussei Quebec TaxID=1398203 RepID=A0A077PHS1_XENBV|nr:hypothetical protein XBKQ1_270003 [Xenorhabdus bovienii str. kraussei Quebec]